MQAFGTIIDLITKNTRVKENRTISLNRFCVCFSYKIKNLIYLTKFRTHFVFLYHTGPAAAFFDVWVVLQLVFSLHYRDADANAEQMFFLKFEWEI